MKAMKKKTCCGSVPVQKGTMIANPPTMKSMSRKEEDHEDMKHAKQKKMGQMMEKKIPKK